MAPGDIFPYELAGVQLVAETDKFDAKEPVLGAEAVEEIEPLVE
jgi:hypothetical protein